MYFVGGCATTFVALCATALVVTATISARAAPGGRLEDTARRVRPWFLLALALVAAAWMTQAVSGAGRIWYRTGVIGLLAGAAMYATVLLAVVVLVVGVARLVYAAARRRTPPRPPAAPGRVAEREDEQRPSRALSWAPLGAGVLLLAAHMTARVVTHGGLLVPGGRVVLPFWINAFVPCGIALVLLGLWLRSLWGGGASTSSRPLSGAEVAGALAGSALLGGALLDLAIFGGPSYLVLPAEAGAACDVVVEQTAMLFTGSVDVLALPDGDLVATTVLPDGPVVLEETFPFSTADGVEAQHEIAWDADGATLSFDAWDNDGPGETVRIDCP